MLRRSLLLCLLLSNHPVHAGVQFLGHGPNPLGVIASGGWSSDLGPGLSASRPIANLAGGFVIEADTSRNLGGGGITARSKLTVAPAGTATFVAPVLVYEGRCSAQNSADLYGRFASASHSACVRFAPPGAGQTVSYAVRWRLTGGHSGVTTLSYLVASPSEYLATQASPDSGTYFGTVPGTSNGLCSFEFSLDVGAPSGTIGAADRTLRVEIYLDSQPIAAAEPSTASGVQLSIPSPNPSRGDATIAYTLHEAAMVHLSVLDVAGRLVSTLERGPNTAGPAARRWDGRDHRGDPVPAGLYFAKLIVQGSGRTVVRTQALVRVR